MKRLKLRTLIIDILTTLEFVQKLIYTIQPNFNHLSQKTHNSLQILSRALQVIVI